MGSKPYVYLFRTYKANYLYDVNTNLVVNIPLKVYEYLDGFMKGTSEDNPCDDEVSIYIDKLKQNGILSTKTVDKIKHPDDGLLEYYLNSKLNMIILQVTQNCNLRCKYCPYTGGYHNRSYSNKHMSIDMAKKCIDFLIHHSTDTDEVCISFYGGEPLLEIDLMEQCVEYSKQYSDLKKIRYSMTTNGTVFNDRIIEFLIRNEFIVLISLDGPKEIQDSNRVFEDGKGSYDRIITNLEYIKSKYPDFYKGITFNMVIDPNADFTCVNEFVSNYELINDSMFMASAINTYYKKDDTVDINDEYNQKRYYEKFKFLLYALGRMEHQHTSRIAENEFNQVIEHLRRNNSFTYRMPEMGHPSGTCIPGVQRLFVDVDGNFYPCERVSEESKIARIGNIHYGFDIDKIRNLLNLCTVNESVCKQCWAFRQCGVCACQVDDLNDISRDLLQRGCASRKNTFDTNLKDYCALIEYGYKL